MLHSGDAKPTQTNERTHNFACRNCECVCARLTVKFILVFKILSLCYCLLGRSWRQRAREQGKKRIPLLLCGTADARTHTHITESRHWNSVPDRFTGAAAPAAPSIPLAPPAHWLTHTGRRLPAAAARCLSVRLISPPSHYGNVCALPAAHKISTDTRPQHSQAGVCLHVAALSVCFCDSQ